MLRDQTNPMLLARRQCYEDGNVGRFCEWMLPRVLWDMAPREFLYDAYLVWCPANGETPTTRTDFYSTLDWAAWNGLLGLWTPCKRQGRGIATRFVVDQPVCDELGLDGWQPSKGFVPKTMYVGVGR